MKQMVVYSNNGYKELKSPLEDFLGEIMILCKSGGTNNSFVFSCKEHSGVNYFTLSAHRSGSDINDISADKRYKPFTHMYYDEIDNLNFSNEIKNDSINRIFDRDFVNQSVIDKLVSEEMDEADLDKVESYILDETQEYDYAISNENLAQILSYVYSEKRIYLRLLGDDKFPINSRLLLKKIYSCIPYALRVKCGCAVGFSKRVDNESIKIFIGTKEPNIIEKEYFDYADLDLDLTTSYLKFENGNRNGEKIIDSSITTITSDLVNNREFRCEVFDEFDSCFSKKSNNPLNAYNATKFKEFYAAIAEGAKACEYYLSKSNINTVIDTEQTDIPHSKYEIYSFDDDLIGSRVYQIAKQYCLDNETKIIHDVLGRAKTFDNVISNDWFQLVSHFTQSCEDESNGGKNKEALYDYLTTQNLGQLLKNTLQKFKYGNENIYYNDNRIKENEHLYSYCEDLSNLSSEFPPNSIMTSSINQFIEMLKCACLNITYRHEYDKPLNLKIIKSLRNFIKKSINEHGLLDNYKENISRLQDKLMELAIQHKKDELKEAFHDDSLYEFISDFFEIEFYAWINGIKQESESERIRRIANYYSDGNDIAGLKNIIEMLDIEGVDNKFIRKILYLLQNEQEHEVKYQKMEKYYENEIRNVKKQHREEYNEIQLHATQLFKYVKKSIQHYIKLNAIYVEVNERRNEENNDLKRYVSQNNANIETGNGSDSTRKFSRTITRFLQLVAILGILSIVVISINFSSLPYNILFVRDTGHIAPIMSQYIPHDGTTSEWYDFTFMAEGVPSPSWSVYGDLPTGLTFHQSDGRLDGIPTEVGRFYFMLTATNEEGNVSRFISIVIEHPLQHPRITGFDAPYGKVGEQYYFRFEALGYPAPTWTHDILPSGLTLNEMGLLSGIPTESGHHTFNVYATNSAGFNRQEVTLYVYYSTSVYSYDTDAPYDALNTITNDPVDNVYIEEASIWYQPYTWNHQLFES